MKTPPVVVAKLGEHLVCDVVAVPGWDGFEKLRAYLERNWSAERLSAADGPDARSCVFRVRGIILTLEFEDPWGNRIVASSAAAEGVLGEIAADLERRLAGNPDPE